jgi:hypothetical protein
MFYKGILIIYCAVSDQTILQQVNQAWLVIIRKKNNLTQDIKILLFYNPELHKLLNI